MLTGSWNYVLPNLPPDKQTSWIAEWDKESFIGRMKTARVFDTSPMPSQAYQYMTDNDLKTIFKFLRTVKSVAKMIDETVIPPDDKS